jgi:hypothetical protein
MNQGAVCTGLMSRKRPLDRFAAPRDANPAERLVAGVTDMRNDYRQRALIKLGALGVVLLFWQTTPTTEAETSSNAVQMTAESHPDQAPAAVPKPRETLGVDACARCDTPGCAQKAMLTSGSRTAAAVAETPTETLDCPPL